MTGFSKEVRELVRQRATQDLEAQFVVCEVMAACPGRAVALWDLHHRRPRAAGGSKRPETNQAANSLAVCRDCHSLIESQREMARQNGWLLRQNQTPSEIPVLYRHRWCLLDDNGGVEPVQCLCGEISDGGWYPGVCVCVDGD